MTQLAALILGGMSLQMVSSPQITLDPESANLITWHGRTLVAAHNYLAGHDFYALTEGEIVTAVFADGRRQYFMVDERHIVIDADEPMHWADVFFAYTGWDQITLITCHPEIGVTDRYMVELEPTDLSTLDVARMKRENHHGTNQ